MDIKLIKVLAFDLDGTLTKSKSNLESDMALILSKLLNYYYIFVISGASKNQFENQFLKFLPKDSNLKNLSIFPENGGSLLIYENKNWISKIDMKFSEKEIEKVIKILNEAIEKFLLKEIPEYGKIIENRGSQITLSALGQNAPLEEKQKWDPDQAKRKEIKKFLDQYLINFEIRIGGATSIDITKKGVNKAIALENRLKDLNISEESLLYFGDALYNGGNDEIVKEYGMKCQLVHNPLETINFLRAIIEEYEQTNSGKTLG